MHAALCRGRAYIASESFVLFRLSKGGGAHRMEDGARRGSRLRVGDSDFFVINRAQR